jgi:hypothetical protein
MYVCICCYIDCAAGACWVECTHALSAEYG